jgi:hypothetical protein
MESLLEPKTTTTGKLPGSATNNTREEGQGNSNTTGTREIATRMWGNQVLERRVWPTSREVVASVIMFFVLNKVSIKNSSGGEIFRTRPDRPWGPPSLLHNVYRVFPGGKAAGTWCWPPTTF